jgi:transposase
VVRLVSFDRNSLLGGEEGGIPSLEVVMRPASVFVRELLPEEGNRLKRLSRKAKSEVTRERALICWASATRMSPQQIAALVGTDESHVRKVIHAFNERGFGSLDPEQRGGRPRRITVEQRARIVAVAGARPDMLGVPAARWSLRRLSRYLREQRIVEVSPAHLRRILAEAGLSFQRTRTFDQMGRRPTTSTTTGSGPGCGHGDVAATTSRSSSRPAPATPPSCRSTGSRTTCRPTGPPTSGPTADANNIELVPTPTYA